MRREQARHIAQAIRQGLTSCDIPRHEWHRADVSKFLRIGFTVMEQPDGCLRIAWNAADAEGLYEPR